MVNVRTDLALEAREIYKDTYKREADGVVVEESTVDDIKVTSVHVKSEDGAIKIGKPMGN